MKVREDKFLWNVDDLVINNDNAEFDEDDSENTEGDEKSVHSHDPHIRAFTPRKGSREKELSAYKKAVFQRFKGYKNKIEFEWLRGDIGDKLRADVLASNGDHDLLVKAFDIAQQSIIHYHKAIGKTRIDFEEDFASLMRKALGANSFGRVQWSSAVRSIIRRYGTQAYIDGLAEGGVFDEALSESDADTIASLVAEQSAYVTNLGEKVFKDDTVTEDMALQKPDMWWNRSIKQFYEAGLLASDLDGVYEFAGKDGDESCTTCMTLKGQRHRLRQWARKGLRPGVDHDSFECGLWKCQHVLVKVFARTSGNWLG